jgi:Uma2 family endonuclease
MGTTTLMSFAEFERLEEGPDQIELLKGELIRVPPPQREHMEICEELFIRLRTEVDLARKTQLGVNLGKVHVEMGYLLSGDPRSWLRPDVSLTHPGQSGGRYYEGAPLMVFEVVSESAAEVWVIYPDTRHAWVYDNSSPAARCETRSIRSPLLPGIEIPLEDIL